MTQPENQQALQWAADEIRKYESVKGHARLVIDIVGGKCKHGESAEKKLFK